MSQSIGTLVIKLEAQTAALRTDIAEARRIIDQNATAMSKAFSSVKSTAQAVAVSVGSIGAALGVSALISYSRHVVEMVGGLGELADQLGVTTDGLQALQYQAIQSGASAEQLETGIARLTRSIGDAAEGNDALINRFRSLGVGVLDANGKVRDTESVLTDVAKALEKIDDPAKKAAAVVDLFGKTGQRLIPTLHDLATNGLDALKDKAKDAGAVVDEALIRKFDDLADRSAVNAKRLAVFAAEGLGAIIEAGKKAKDVLDDVFLGTGRLSSRQSVGPRTGARGKPGATNWGVLDQSNNPTAIARRGRPSPAAGGELMGFDMSPNFGGPLTAPTQGLAPNIPKSSRELQNTIAGDMLVKQLTTQFDGLEKTTAAQLRLRLERERDVQVVNGIITDIGPKYTKSQIDAAVAIQQHIDALVDLRRRQIDAGATAAAQSAERDRERAASAEARNVRGLSANRADLAVRDMRDQIPIIQSARIEWNKYTGQFESVNDELEVFIRKQRIIAEGRVGPGEAERQARNSVAADRDVLKAQQEKQAQVDQMNASYQFLGNAGEMAFQRVGDAMAAMALEGGNAFASLRNIGASVAASLYADFLKLALLNPLKNLINGNSAMPTIGSVLSIASSFLGFGQAAGGPTGAYGNIVGLGLPFGGPRAGGGDVGPGKSYLVGEKGPELVSFGAAGRVFPAGDTAEMMAGGGGGTYYIDARGADQAAVARLEQSIRTLNGSIERRSLSAVADDFARGGSISRMVRA